MRGVLAMLLMIATPANAAPWLAGTWFGTGQPHDRSEMWIAHMSPDGAFHAQFRTCRKGKAIDSYNEGSWTLNGAIATIRVVLVDGQFYPRTDLYEITAHDGKSQTYKYLKTGFVYRSGRVSDKFQMPRCDLVS